MSPQDAETILKEMKVSVDEFGRGPWKDKRRIATDTWRAEAIKALSRDKQNEGFALVVIQLNQDIPEIDEFAGIFAVDDRGIWWYDGDGNINECIWRQSLIPWHCVLSVTIHQVS